MSQRNEGYAVELKMGKLFKGKVHGGLSDAVDMETKNFLFEIKSCHFFINSKSAFGKTMSRQLGRWTVDRENHRMLRELAMVQKKKAKYIFAILIERRIVWKSVTWEFVDAILEKKVGSKICIGDVFK